LQGDGVFNEKVKGKPKNFGKKKSNKRFDP